MICKINSLQEQFIGQNWSSALCPLQSRPPNAGAGFEQVLERCLMRGRHATGQELQALHSDNPPSTGAGAKKATHKTSERLNIWKAYIRTAEIRVEIHRRSSKSCTQLGNNAWKKMFRLVQAWSQTHELCYTRCSALTTELYRDSTGRRLCVNSYPLWMRV